MIYILLTTISFIFAYFYYHNSQSILAKYLKILLITLRTLVLSGVLILLFSPIIKKQMMLKEGENIAILVDHSLSMENEVNQRKKTEIMQDFRSKLEDELAEKQYVIDVIPFADSVSASNQRSFLREKITNLFAEKNYKEIHLLSDGWLNDESFDFLDNLPPVYTYGLENKQNDVDLFIENVSLPKKGFIEENQPINIKLGSENYTGLVNIEAFINGISFYKSEVDVEKSKTIQIKKSFETPGIYNIAIELKPLKQEKNRKNNKAIQAISIRDGKPKILILADVLNWDTAFISKTLRANDLYRIKVLHQINGDFYSGKEVQLLQDNFDDVNVCVITSQNGFRLKESEQQLLTRFVRRGGRILFQGKPTKNMIPLLGIKNIVLNRAMETTISFHPNASKYSAFNKLMQNKDDLFPLPSFLVEEKVSTKVLLQANMDQFITTACESNNGKGKVLSIFINDLWKYGLQDFGVFSLYDKIIQYLINSADARFIASSSKIEYFSKEDIEIKLQAYDETLSLRQHVSAETKIIQNDTLVVKKIMLQDEEGYSATISGLKPGRYQFVATDLDTQENSKGQFIVQEFNNEIKDNGFNNPLLQYISNVTNGDFRNKLTVPNIEKAKISEEVKLRSYPIYKNKILIIFLLFVFTLELFIRRRLGLL